MNIKQFIKMWAPPGLIRSIRHRLDYVRPAPWEYMPEGWSTIDKRITGWNLSGITETQKKKWPFYVNSLQGTSPLGINHEAELNADPKDIAAHNTLISYAYVLALASRMKQRISLLDWGGGIGHYYVLSAAVLPDTAIDYFCYDLPLLCEVGQELLPEAHFLQERDACFSRDYDLVLASSSIWYEEDWRSVVRKLASVSRNYLYVARMLFIDRAGSYVAVQRPKAMGYDTEYLCWVFNRTEFIDCVTECGMELVREFILSDGPHIHRAPEQGDMRGFLFRRKEPVDDVIEKQGAVT